MFASDQLFIKMFDCICRGNGITSEEGFAQLVAQYGERSVDDKAKPVTDPKKATAVEPATKPQSAKFVAPKFKLPWTGTVVPGWCQGLRHHGGLMSQCSMKPKSDGFCSTCLKSIEKKGHPERGTVQMRIEADSEGDTYKYDGKSPVTFATVMKKQKISKEDAISEAAKFELIIPEREFVIEEKKKGRPAAPVASPPSGTIDDIINDMVNGSSSPEPAKEPTPEPAKEPTPEPAKEPTPEPAKEPTPEPAKEPTPEPAKEPTPEPAKEPTPEPAHTAANVDQGLVIESYDSDYDASTDEESVNIIEWVHKGIKYFKSEDGCDLYDYATQAPIGAYDIKTDSIIPCVDESSDEEDF